MNTINTQSNVMPDSPVERQVIAPAARSATQSLYWSIRRELWEYRSIYIAPLAVAVVVLLGSLIEVMTLPHRMRGVLGSLDPMKQHELLEQPYNLAALALMGTYLFVAVFYCLDALHGERRDRSILFWKSLPVSDLTIVLSKASIPMLVLPLLTFAITLATQWIMLLLSTVVLAASGLSVATLWRLPWFQMSLMLLYHLLAVHALYYAPIYGWLILVSAWVRRAAFLWAGLPLLAIGVIEKIAFNTSHLAEVLGARIGGGSDGVDYPMPGGGAMDASTLLAMGKLLISPSMWIGLALFAAFLAGAVRLRRSQGPI